MKAKDVTFGPAILAAGRSSTTPTVTPSSATPTTAGSSSATSTTQTQTNGKPPPVPHCYYTGSGYGYCEGIVLPMTGTVVLFTHPDRSGVFRLGGPTPLQTKDVSTTISTGPCAPRSSPDAKRTRPRVMSVSSPFRAWTAVFVRQNSDPVLLYLLWNSGQPGRPLLAMSVTRTSRRSRVRR
jgi:hypothetical protein